MLKIKEAAASSNMVPGVHQSQTGSVSGANGSLLRSVIRANPQFNRLDGLLSGLADACMKDSAEDMHMFGVCSSIRGEGKTTIAMGLATALARRSAATTLLVEADLATPSLARDMNLPARGGLAECLLGQATWSSVVQATPVPHLSIITAGSATNDPLSLVGRKELDELASDLRKGFRYVVFDMPPILEREDCSRLVELVDSIVFLIGAGKVSQQTVEAGIAAAGKDKLMGVVLNGAWNHAPEWLARLVSEDTSAPTHA